MSPEIFPNWTRRKFLKNSGTAAMIGALTPAILTQRAFAQNSETLKIGLIGCGGRGTGAAHQALNAESNVALVAMGDAHEDRLNSSLDTLKKQDGAKVQVTPEKTFIGLDAYQKVIDSGVDVVLLTTPPGFRPMHLQAAIAANKHVFCEKPMAVDGPGVRSVLASAAEAKKKGLALVAGFCWRYATAERELMKRIHDGEIGELRALQNQYLTGPIWVKPRQPGQTDLQYQLRNWYYFTWLSGDHIAEQAVHSIDKMNWAMKDEPPVSCVAIGGRQQRTGPEFGHIYDHFGVIYHYKNGQRGFHFSRQQAGCFGDVSDYIMGSKGIGRIKTFSTVDMVGEKNWRFPNDAKRPDMYQVEHNELFASIRAGKPINDGEWMAKSTLLAVMGRMAAYTGQTITWEQALNSEESLMPEKLDWDMKLPSPEVAIPGVTKFA